LHIFNLRSVWSDTDRAGVRHLSDTSKISNDSTDIFTEVLIRVGLPVGDSTLNMMEDILVVDDNFLTDMNHQRPGRGQTLHSLNKFLNISISTLAI